MLPCVLNVTPYLKSANVCFQGEVFWVDDQREAPFSAPPIPDLPGTLRMVNIGLSEYVFNTMGYSLQKIPEAAKGALAKNLTQDDVSEE